VPILDRLMLKLDRDRPELYQQAVDDVVPDTAVHVLAPGQPLSL
jgi:hypothetical protein